MNFGERETQYLSCSENINCTAAFFIKTCGIKTTTKTVKVAIIVGAETRLCGKHFENRKDVMLLPKADVLIMAVYQAKSAMQLTKSDWARYASPAYPRRVKHCGCTDKSAKKNNTRGER